MDVEEFLEAALAQLSDEICTAAAAQATMDRRITPEEVMKIAEMFGAPRGPVLALVTDVFCRRFRVLDPSLLLTVRAKRDH